jgi:lipopolysaccharide/colanic/teichoic acid biosynthesis glycosyltransferase
LSGSQAIVKRAFDLLVGVGTIVITGPIWLAAAVAIKTTSRGPVLFRQERVGRHGSVFTIHKFRTMVADAEEQKSELLALSAGPLFKLEVDPRITRVGRFLRRWSIDELPQLIDVIRGEMSLVGPRPLVMFERNELEEWHLQRLEVPPGMTGLWQTSGRSDLSFDECVKLDVFYIENWSVTYDLYILLKTLPAVLRRRGAY